MAFHDFITRSRGGVGVEECDPDPLLLVPLPAISRFFEATPAARRRGGGQAMASATCFIGIGSPDIH